MVRDSKSLGAPQVLEINDTQVFRWKVAGKGDPILLEEMELGGIGNLFARNNDVWSPQQMLRAKATGQVATQLDFFDHDLMPLLDYEVRTKLDRLLRDTVTLATETFQKRFELKKHLVLCRLEGRPPHLDLELYPYLPQVRVSITSAGDSLRASAESTVPRFFNVATQS